MPISALSNEHEVLTQIERLSRRVDELGRLVAGQPESVRTLRELIEYAVLRPVDLVQLDGDPYFCYVRDLLYTHFAEQKPDAFVRSYALTDADLEPPKPFAFTIAEFLQEQRRAFPRNEHYAKLVILAHLWQHDVAFTLLDVGANIGYSAVPCAKFAQRFGRHIDIHCFEPGLAADLLPANIELNRVGGMLQAHRLALSDRAAPVAFNSMLGHSVCDSVVDFRKHYPHLIPAMSRVVSATTIDQFVRDRNITHTLVLKIDAEGHDLQVLRGARESFQRGQVGVTIVEFVPHYLKEFIAPEELLIDLAREHHLLSILELGNGYRWRPRALPGDPDGLRRFAQDVARCPLRYTDIIAIARRLPEAQLLCRRLCEE